jgi:hypothetical protein
MALGAPKTITMLIIKTKREEGEHHAHSTLARHRQPVARRVAACVAVRPWLRQGSRDTGMMRQPG